MGKTLEKNIPLTYEHKLETPQNIFDNNNKFRKVGIGRGKSHLNSSSLFSRFDQC